MNDRARRREEILRESMPSVGQLVNAQTKFADYARSTFSELDAGHAINPSNPFSGLRGLLLGEWTSFC